SRHALPAGECHSNCTVAANLSCTCSIPALTSRNIATSCSSTSICEANIFKPVSAIEGLVTNCCTALEAMSQAQSNTRQITAPISAGLVITTDIIAFSFCGHVRNIGLRLKPLTPRQMRDGRFCGEAGWAAAAVDSAAQQADGPSRLRHCSVAWVSGGRIRP